MFVIMSKNENEQTIQSKKSWSGSNLFKKTVLFGIYFNETM